MNLRAVIIDEPIHTYDEQACKLWQKTMWVKELGYRGSYKSAFLPIGTDDFFGTHLIVANELPNGELDPVAMYKSVRKSQAERFRVPFGVVAMLASTPYKDSPDLLKIINNGEEISYDSAWTINPAYKKDKEFSQLLRDFMTMFACNYHLSFGFNRWLSGGAKQFKVGDYFKWLGGQQIMPDFELLNFDNQVIQLIYIENTNNVPPEVLEVKKRMEMFWRTRIIYAPQESKVIKVAV